MEHFMFLVLCTIYCIVFWFGSELLSDLVSYNLINDNDDGFFEDIYIFLIQKWNVYILNEKWFFFCNSIHNVISKLSSPLTSDCSKKFYVSVLSLSFGVTETKKIVADWVESEISVLQQTTQESKYGEGVNKVCKTWEVKELFPGITADDKKNGHGEC